MSAQAAAAELLAAALARPAPPPLQLLHLPAPLALPEALLRAAQGEDGVLFAPPEDVAIAGFGAACAVDVAPGESLNVVQQRATRLLRDVEELGLDTHGAPRARMLGALASSPSAVPASPIGAGRFMLPRWRYARAGDEAWLSVAVAADECSSADRRQALVAEYRRLCAALAEPVKAPSASEGEPQFIPSDHAHWVELIGRACAEFEKGTLEKVVLARSSTVRFAQPIDPVAVLERLAADGGWGTRFAWRGAKTSFLGLTPERLVRREGMIARADALAGSSPTGDAEALTHSRKDAGEHGHVVREIVRALTPVCTRLSVPEKPGLRKLRHLLHLHTPIEGTLHEPLHVLELLSLLHPTPAVGGVPRELALRFIDAHEGQPRGLYAGPFGWFDQSGDGDFWVALRSGVIEGAEARVWGGAGIVRGSDAEAEWRETDLKQRSFLRALGVRS